MLTKTREFITKNNLYGENSRLLLAVSGGIDSMVMLEIFRLLPFTISVVHCNFSLRGRESDDDQKHVESYCREYNISCHTKRFDTQKFAKSKGISIQMAARDLRYYWFEEIRTELNFDSIVLAHNKDDIIETFFVNLSRGTGLKGLTGIKPRNNYLSRPLLYASRNDIENYAENNNVAFREDSSNIETRYKRNAIRHKIIPLFRELNPSFLTSMELTIKRLEEADIILNDNVKTQRDNIFIPAGNDLKVQVEKIMDLSPLDIYIYELFKDFGIGQSGVDELKKLLVASPGKHISTETHTIYKDREYLIITRGTNKGSDTIIVENPEDFDDFVVKVLNVNDVKISNESKTAYLDYDKVKFPITLRQWREGDWFHPFGMKGKKKLSDFFIDLKIPVNQKNKISIFLSDGNIFWVAGYRIDTRFAISEKTSKVLVISQKS